MSKRKIPENTPYFQYTDLNPKHVVTTDCVIRAISYAENIPWEEVFDALCKLAKEKCRMPNAPQVYEKYLKDHGWEKQKQPRKPDGKKVMVAELADQYRNQDVQVLVTIPGHMTVINCGVIHDIWNCGYRSISNYWIRRENS